jgi:hypothetical protein
VYQIKVTRGQAGASGNVHFSATPLLRRDPDGLTQRLLQDVYAQPALVPASPWLDRTAPSPPQALALAPDPNGAGQIVTWRASGAKDSDKSGGGNAPSSPWLWVVQMRRTTTTAAGGDQHTWTTTIVPGNQGSFSIPASSVASEVRLPPFPFLLFPRWPCPRWIVPVTRDRRPGW